VDNLLGHNVLMASLRLVITAVCAALVLTVAPSATAVVDGTPDATRTYVVFVGQLTRDSTGHRNACTGVLVAPTVVVTAAHCGLIDGVAPDGQPFLVFQGPAIGVPPASPGFYFKDPEFAFGGNGVPHFTSHDLAVIELAAPLPGPYGKLPSPGLVDSLNGSTRVTISGYGVSEIKGNLLNPASAGVRKSADAKLAGGGILGDQFVKVVGGVCEGDSGGPVLLGDVALAVNSFAAEPCKSTTYSTRLDTPSARAFLTQFGV
jgi:hypothetical protein